MDRIYAWLKQRWLWTGLAGLAALAFWVVGLGAGWRGWIINAPGEGGIVAHTQAFGFEAYIWWIPATVLTMTTVVMAIGLSIVRHLVDGPVEVLPTKETLEESEPLEELVEAEPAPERELPEGEAPAELPSGDAEDEGGGATR